MNALILKGETAENGKSQILDLLRSLVPSGALTAISLRHFGDGRDVIEVAGKLLNAPDELGSNTIVSGDLLLAWAIEGANGVCDKVVLSVPPASTIEAGELTCLALLQSSKGAA